MAKVDIHVLVFFCIVCSSFYSVLMSTVSPSVTLDEMAVYNETNSTMEVNSTAEVVKLCTIRQTEQNYTILCQVNSNETFEFIHFRKWSESQSNKSLIFLTVSCETGGIMKLPWPFRSYYLTSLIVTGCRVHDFLSEIKDNTIINSITVDNLQYIHISYTNVEIEFEQAEEALKGFQNISAENECGPLKARVYIWRSVGIDIIVPDYFPLPPEGDDDNEGVVGRQEAVRANNNPSHICDYKYTEIYESSHTTGLSTFDFKFLGGNSQFPSLKVYSYTNTSLSDIPSELVIWRDKFPKIETMDLSHNKLQLFHFKDIGSIKGSKVGYINLQYNNIATLTEKEIRSLKLVDSAMIDVRNNPFMCKCNVVTYFNNFLRKYTNPAEAGLKSHYDYLWDLKCVGPPRLKGRKISELNHSILCDPDVSAYITPVIALSILVIILIVIIILIVRFRKDIRILFFTRLHIILPFQTKGDETHKEYDAFISYCNADTEWVLKTLAPGLEASDSSFNFKLCLHHRDFEIGSYICDNIISSVETSRHTVLVVSKKFLESHWCTMEFRTALQQSLIEKKKHMVMILIEELPLDKIDNDFRRCLQMMTYIKADDALFWDRIRYALSKKSRIKSPSNGRSGVYHVS